MIVERDVPITASDGVVLRADVFRPANEAPAPVIMALGPYGKGVEYKDGYSTQWQYLLGNYPNILSKSTKSYMTWETVDPELWTELWGYICIRVDSRGTGRSPGTLEIFSPREVEDYYDAIEWAGTQKWSNGKVGLNGISYYGMNQWLVAQLKPPHLTAMIPWEAAADAYRDFHRHGGILSNTFLESWYAAQVQSNQHGNPRGRDDPWLKDKATGPEMLSPEQLEANRNDPHQQALKRALEDEWYRERSTDWSKVTVPFLSASNWGGIGLHARGNTEAFTRAASKQKWLEIHPARHDVGFYFDDAIELQKRFLDHFLKGVDNGWQNEPPVILHGRSPGKEDDGIHKYQNWPIPDTSWTKMHLSAVDKALRRDSLSITKAETTFDASTGETRFISAPLERDTEITGPVAAKLFISSSTSDADLFLTFQAFSPSGKEVEFQGAWDPHTPLTQGWLRASHRKLDPTLSKPHRPYHSHDEQQPLEPNDVYEVNVEMWPTSIRLPAGCTFSIMVAGRDFSRPNNDPTLNWRQQGSGPFQHRHPEDRGSETFAGKTTIHTGGDYDSYILLPFVGEQ